VPHTAQSRHFSKALSIFKRACPTPTLHAIQIFTTASSSTHHSSVDALLQHEDTLLHLTDNLPHSAGALPPYETTPPHILSQAKVYTIPGSDRSKHRNVHIFNASDRNTTIGGLILTTKNDETNCVTNANFYNMIEIIAIITSAFTLQNESNVIIEKDNSPLQPGKYYIYTSGKFLNSFIYK
jgi:hypothetical protein